MQRLIEYRKYKEAAETFKERELEAHQTFTRPPVVFDNLHIEKTIVQGDISIYDMLGALGKMMERKKWKEPIETRIQKTVVPIEQRMIEVLDFIKTRHEVTFDELFTQHSKAHIVVTFMAILELMKINQVTCKQTKHFDTLYVHYSGDEE